MNIIINEQQSLKYCEETIQLKQKLELGWLELCKRIYTIHEQGLADISQYGSFDLYLSEIKLKPTTAIHMRLVYKRFCVELGIEEELVMQAGGYTRAYELLPMAKTPESAREALEIAIQAPSRNSIIKQVRATLSGVTQDGTPIEDDCLHENVAYIKVCTDCKEKLSVSSDKN